VNRLSIGLRPLPPASPASPARGLSRVCRTVTYSAIRDGSGDVGENVWRRTLLFDAVPEPHATRVLSDLVAAMSEASAAGGGPRLGLGVFSASPEGAPTIPGEYDTLELRVYAAGGRVVLPGPCCEIASGDLPGAAEGLLCTLSAACRNGETMQFPSEWCPDEGGWWFVRCPRSAEPAVIRLAAAAGRTLASKRAEGELGYLVGWEMDSF